MLHLLYNPFADGGHGKEAANEAIGKLKAVRPEVEAVNSSDVDLNEYFKKLGKDDEVALLGGDGTLNYFINHVDVMPTNRIYLYPSGTGNDFLNDVRGEIEEKDGLYLLNPYLENLPVIEVKGKTYRFINGIGFGIDGECCVVAEEMKRKGETKINYSGISVKLLLGPYKPRTATVKVDDKEPIVLKKAYLASVMHGRFYGGNMKIAPNQKRGTHTLTAVVVHEKMRIPMLLAFPGLTKGNHLGKKWAKMYTGKCIEISFDEPCGLQIDGEVVEGVTSYKAYIK